MADRAPEDRKAWILSAVDEFERPLTLYAARVLGDAERARDVVQDVFLKLCDQNPQAIASRLKPWLFTVCRNRALDVRRKEKRMNRLSDERAASQGSNDPAPPDALEHKESASHVLQMLAGLPDNQQDVLRLKFQHGLSYREIGEVTNLTVSNVGFLIHTALKRLRAQLGPAMQT